MDRVLLKEMETLCTAWNPAERVRPHRYMRANRICSCILLNSDSSLISSMMAHYSKIRYPNPTVRNFLSSLKEPQSTIVMNVLWEQDVHYNIAKSIQQAIQEPPTGASMIMDICVVHGSRDMENQLNTASTLRELINLDKLEMMRTNQRPLESWFGSTGTDAGASANIAQFLDGRLNVTMLWSRDPCI